MRISAVSAASSLIADRVFQPSRWRAARNVKVTSTGGFNPPASCSKAAAGTSPTAEKSRRPNPRLRLRPTNVQSIQWRFPMGRRSSGPTSRVRGAVHSALSKAGCCPTLTSPRNCGKITPLVGDRLVVGHVTLDHSAEVRTLVPQFEEKKRPRERAFFVGPDRSGRPARSICWPGHQPTPTRLTDS